MLKSNLTEEELREIEESIDMNEIDKELENVNFQHDPNYFSILKIISRVKNAPAYNKNAEVKISW